MDVDKELEKLRRARRPQRPLYEESWLEIILWELLKGIDVTRILLYAIAALAVGMTLFGAVCSGF